MSFLRNYLTYAVNDEAPDIFHVWAAYACLSAAISRRVWLPHSDWAVFPNIYVIFVGNAGNGKSVALRKAKRILSEVNDIPISRSIETPEALWRFMSGAESGESPVAFVTRWPDGQLREVHPMTIIANEFVNYISTNPVGWINALNDIYDEDRYEYRTKNRGEDILIGPYIVLLGALTTDVSTDLQKAKIISTGFARRTLFQYGERKWHQPVPSPIMTPEQLAAKNACVTHLRQLRKLQGQFKLTAEATAFYENWYINHIRTVPNQPPQLQGWFASKSTQVQKLAMLTSLSERDDLVIEQQHFECALAYLDILEEDLPRIFGGMSRNELASIAGQIYAFLEHQKEPISKTKLKALFFHLCKPPTEFDDCITYLTQANKIMQIVVQVGDKVDVVIATPAVGQAFHERVASTQK